VTDPIAALDARLRDVERNAALQGQTLDILREDAIQHADRETVAKLQAVQTVHGEDIAVLKSKMTDSDGGRAAAILRAVTAPLKEALHGNVWALLVLVVGAPFILVAVLGIVLAVTGQLDETLAALRGTPEITVRDGGRVDADRVDTRALDVEADEVHVAVPPPTDPPTSAPAPALPNAP